MNSRAAKSIHVLLVLFIFAAAVPVCTGAENCSMPCCRHKAQPTSHPPASHPMDTASGRGCCTRTTDGSADSMLGCRFVNASPALPSAADGGLGITPEIGAVDFGNPIERPAAVPVLGVTESGPPDTPLYLRLQTLLI